LPFEILHNNLDSYLEEFRKESSRKGIEDSAYYCSGWVNERTEDFQLKVNNLRAYWERLITDELNV